MLFCELLPLETVDFITFAIQLYKNSVIILWLREVIREDGLLSCHAFGIYICLSRHNAS